MGLYKMEATAARHCVTAAGDRKEFRWAPDAERVQRCVGQRLVNGDPGLGQPDECLRLVLTPYLSGSNELTNKKGFQSRNLS